MELELSIKACICPSVSNYIIPIWNWSVYSHVYQDSKDQLLHYSYMELEHFSIAVFWLSFKYYIIPIWNWSTLKFYNYMLLFIINYIIPIWNWSTDHFLFLLLNTVYYIIPIWNWSKSSIAFLVCFLLITLFLYGIGAFK